VKDGAALKKKTMDLDLHVQLPDWDGFARQQEAKSRPTTMQKHPQSGKLLGCDEPLQ
jgi:hypothetical protein